MKRLKFHRAIVAIAMMLIGWLPSLAHDFEVNGIYYSYVDKLVAKTVEVTYKGDSFDSFLNEYTGNVNIPETVTYSGVKYSVISIGDDAFASCDNLTSVTIGNSVKSIDFRAFGGCDGLTSVTVPNSVTSIGNSAFSCCSGLTSVTIGNSVTSIGSSAFYECDNLTSVTFGNSVTSIGDSAFSCCYGLTSVTIGNSVTSIGSGAFYHCVDLTSVRIPDSVTSIGSDAFYECVNLTSVIIGKSVTTIGMNAFRNCKCLKTVEFYCPSVSLASYSFKTSSTLNLFFFGGEIKTLSRYDVFETKLSPTFFVSSPKVETFRQKLNNYTCTIKELTAEEVAKYCDSEKLTNESDEEKTGTVSFSGSGSGTESDPFLIFNPVQLNDVRNSVGHSGVYYKLMSDIDMTEWIAENNPQQGWQPIGNLSSMFKGTFIGNGKKITGLTINRSTTDYVGFFGYVHSAKITDLTIEGNIVGNYDTGGIFGKANVSEIDNCRFIGNVKGNGNVGGVVGYSILSNINNTHFSGKITGSGKCGGVIGRADIKPVDSIVITDGCLTGTFNANIKISNVSANCDITSSGDCVGGVVGYLYTSSIVIEKDTGKLYFNYNVSTSIKLTNAIHKGSINGNSCLGGIIGKSQLGDTSKSALDNGNISASVSFDGCQHIGNISGGYEFIGGVIGKNQHTYEQNSTSLSNCFSIGDIVSPTGRGAGLIGGCVNYSGVISNIEVNNCYAQGNINSNGNYTGGLIGSFEGGTNSVSNCYALGNINTTGQFSGGLFGTIWGDTNSISDCYFSGTIYGTHCVGGLAGHAKSTSIVTSYSNASSISGDTQVGGIVGFLGDGSSIKSCISANEKVNASKDEVGRVYGATSGGATLGTMNTAKENKGLATMIVNKNGVQQLLEDGPQHGTNVGRSTLKLKSTYQGLGWDFTTNWTNQETESYPYKQTQTAPPVLTSKASSGATVISGKSVNGGIVYVVVGDKTYTAQVQNNTWSVTVEPLTSGEIVTAYAKATDFAESYRVYQTVEFKGAGTESDPYQIYTAQELANVNGTGYYMLMNDIDLTEWINKNSPSKGWIPLGRNGNVMSHLLGNNHTISGLWCNTDEDYTALIAMAESISIKDLTVKAVSGKSIKGGNYTAVIIGKANDCVLENCHVVGSVIGNDYLGGLAGYVASGSIGNCSSEITIEGGKNLGGILGDTSAKIYSCSSISNITGNKFLGGILGQTSSPYVKECRAVCTILGSADDWSFAGGITGASTAEISTCYASGNINLSITSGGTSCYVGGITGENKKTVKDCYSTVELSSSQYAAGIVGYNSGVVDKCYSSGDISAVHYGAGIVGYNDGESAVVTNCIAANNVISVSSEKGIAMRVIGGFKNGAPTPDTSNYALGTMAVSVNGIPQKIYDDVLHGMSKTQAVLMQGATYSALGWDMSSVWGINENMDYPYLQIFKSTEIVPITSLTLDKAEATVNLAETIQLTATLLPSDATNTTLQWESSDNKIATVSESGVVTAIALGEATITATTTDGSNLQAKCKITVVDPNADQPSETNYMLIPETEAFCGTSIKLPIELVNEDEIISFQCDLYLPDGITITDVGGKYDITLNNSRNSDFMLNYNKLSDGTLRIIGISFTSTPIKGNSGELINIGLDISSDCSGEYTIEVRDIIMSDINGKEIVASDIKGSLNVIDYILGDANGDGKVNIVDASAVINYVLGKSPAKFVIKAADVNCSGSVNIADASGIINIVLGKATTNAPAVLNSNSLDDCLIAEGVDVNKLSLALVNNNQFTSFQFDLKVENNVELKNILPSVRLADSHKIFFNKISDQTYRIACVSMSNETIDGECSNLMDLIFENSDNTRIEIDNIIFSTPNAVEYLMESIAVDMPETNSIDNVYTQTDIYIKGKSVVVESPCDCVTSITSLTGVVQRMETSAGINFYNLESGFYIVSSNNITKKIIIK